MQVPDSDDPAPEAAECPEEAKKSEPSPTVGGDAGNGDDESVLDVSGRSMEFSMIEDVDDAVRSLYLYKNAFNLIPKSVGSLGDLRTLKFFGNEINLFPSEIGTMAGLENLQVKISSPGFGGLRLHKLKELKELELSKVPPRPSSFQILSEIASLKCLTKLSVCHFSIRLVEIWGGFFFPLSNFEFLTMLKLPFRSIAFRFKDRNLF